MDKSVTVGIPFCNQVNYDHLKNAIDSIVNQTVEIDSIHLIKDGSVSSDLEDLIQGYNSKYSNIEILSFSKK